LPLILSPWVRALIAFGVHVSTDIAWQLYQQFYRRQDAPPVELRRAQLIWTPQGAGNIGEDVRVSTFDFLNITDGEPDTSWTAADFINAETRLVNFWNAIKARYTQGIKLEQIRWYAIGPNIVHSGPPRRVLPLNLPGTAAANESQLPPQVALTMTERTEAPRSWGRVYLPAPSQAQNADGRAAASLIAAVANAAVPLYTEFGTEEIVPVVWSPAKDVRGTAKGGTLPAQPPRALTVSKIQVDNVWDVIRSRRFREGIAKEVRPLP
jgi:hypothetical protein